MSKSHPSMKVGASMGLYDSDTNQTVFCDKVISVSKDCKIRYGNVKRGRIAQINSLRPDGGPGSWVHYHVNECSASYLANDEVFKRFARNLNLDPMELAIKIVLNA